MFRRSLPRVELQAVDDEGLKNLLLELGVLDTLGTSAQCSECRCLVSLETIAAVYPQDEEVRFLCVNAKCVSRDGEDRG